ncbi:MAG: hypothetical protein VX265_07140 [Myxococcota bacterium]|nr:hypothetical protein [Myxococcota bacterium]
MPIVLLLAACFPADPDSALFQGIVRSGPAYDDPTLPEATLTSFDADGAQVSTAVSDGDGSFEIAIPWGGLFAVVVEADGHMPTSMSGVGQTDTVLAPNGAVFARPDAWWETAQTTWSGCPDLETGPVVEGILRAYLPVPNQEVDTLPVINTGSLTLDIDEDDPRIPCYLDDLGVYDPDASVTGDTGQFLFANVPPGWATVRSTFTADESVSDGMDHAVFVPAAGVVTLDPAMAETPGL